MSNDFDQISRDRIKNDIHSNFFVEAGAGSGKTSVLVKRMVSMVEQGIDISKICAITFTKAAAGEFYSRFQEKLSECKSDAAQKALKDIDLCFMGTIDSFCNMVLSEHPAAAMIPSNTAIADEDTMKTLFRREYSRILKGEYGSTLQEKGRTFSAMFGRADSVFINGLGILMDCKDAHFNYVKPKAGGVDTVFTAEKSRITSILQYLLDHPEAVCTDKPAGAAKAWETLNNNQDTLLGDWSDDLNSVIRSLKDLSGLRVIKEYESKMDELGPGWDKFFKAHETRGKLAWYEIDTDEDPFIIEKLNTYRFSAAMDFINDAIEPVSQTLRKEGHLTFFDCLLYLRDMLKADAAADGKLIQHIYDRHSYFLIDEFQDTNPLQAEVFFYLTAEKPDPDWRKCVPKPGSLFIVGDPKQSIYRFRNADVASFIKVRKLFEKPVGEVLRLSRNFRSTDLVCSWFNHVFTELLPEDTDTQSRFSLIPLGEKAPYKAVLNGAYTYTVNKKSKAGYDDPARVADIIRRLLADPAFTVQGREKGDKPRRLQYKDFMIITPTKTGIDQYAKALSELEIPFYVEGKIVFSECPALVSLAQIVSAAADPFDKKAEYAALMKSGAEIDKEQVFELSKRSKAMSPASLCAFILDEYKLFAKLGAENAEYLYFAIELLRQAETDGTVTNIKEGAAYLGTLIADASGQERSIQLAADSNRVHIANLHKVKGLEAPVVILSNPHSKTFEPQKRVDYRGDIPQSYLFSLPTGDGFNSNIKSTDFAEEQAKEAAVLQDESVRLLYVAATRAENLLIVGKAIDPKDGSLDPNNPWTPFLKHIDKEIYSVLGEYIPYTPAAKQQLSGEELYKDAESCNVLKDKASAATSYTIKRPSTITLKGVTASEDDYDDKAADKLREDRSSIVPTLLGTMVHRIMEVLVSSRNAADEDTLIRETLLEYQAEPSVYEAKLRSVVQTIRNGGYKQDNGVPADILSELLSAEEVYCELPFCYNESSDGSAETAAGTNAGDEAQEKTRIWNGIMDVVYKKDDVWHIVDYKTNADTSDLDTHYRDQLSAYEKAFAAMTGQEAKAKVYHIDAD